MSDDFFVSGKEDKERAKLPQLAKELGWKHEVESSSDEKIMGEINGKSFRIRVDRKLLLHDVVEFSIKAPSKLQGMVRREEFLLKVSKELAATLNTLGVTARCDIETGDKAFDRKFFFEVKGENFERMQMLVENREAFALLKEILSSIDQITFTGHEIQFYKFMRTGDLDLANVQKVLKWLQLMDANDGIYL